MVYFFFLLDHYSSWSNILVILKAILDKLLFNNYLLQNTQITLAPPCPGQASPGLTAGPRSPALTSSTCLWRTPSAGISTFSDCLSMWIVSYELWAVWLFDFTTVWLSYCPSENLPVWLSVQGLSACLPVCMSDCLWTYYLPIFNSLFRDYLPAWLSVQGLFACLTVRAGTICLSANVPVWLSVQRLSTCLCRDYVTEKLFSALQADVVPVVLGGADYSSLLPPHSYIDMQVFLPPTSSYLVYLPSSHHLYLPSFYIFPPSTSSLLLHLPSFKFYISLLSKSSLVPHLVTSTYSLLLCAPTYIHIHIQILQ